MRNSSIGDARGRRPSTRPGSLRLRVLLAPLEPAGRRQRAGAVQLERALDLSVDLRRELVQRTVVVEDVVRAGLATGRSFVVRGNEPGGRRSRKSRQEL